MWSIYPGLLCVVGVEFADDDGGPFPVLVSDLCYSRGENHSPYSHIERLQEKPKQQDRGGSADQRRNEERYAVVGSNEAGRHGVVLL